MHEVGGKDFGKRDRLVEGEVDAAREHDEGLPDGHHPEIGGVLRRGEKRHRRQAGRADDANDRKDQDQTDQRNEEPPTRFHR